MKANIKAYVKARDEMLKLESVVALRKFVNEYKHFYSKEFVEQFNAAPDAVVEITLHKMIVNAVKLPKEMQAKSAMWLVSRGYNLSIV